MEADNLETWIVAAQSVRRGAGIMVTTPPCQDYSAGTAAIGLRGTRGRLAKLAVDLAIL